MFKNSKKQGDAAVGLAIAYFSKIGQTVSIPLTDSQDYDLIVDTGEKLLKVQVKSSYKGLINLRVLGGNSKKNFVHKTPGETYYDLLFAVNKDGSYLIPKISLKNIKSTISLGGWKMFKINDNTIFSV